MKASKFSNAQKAFVLKRTGAASVASGSTDPADDDRQLLPAYCRSSNARELPNYQNRHRAPSENLACLAAEKNARNTTPAMRRHHDQVASELAARLYDSRSGRRLVRHMKGVQGNPDLTGSVLDLRKQFRRSISGFVFEALGLNGSRLPLSSIDNREGLGDRDDGYLAAESFSQ